MNRIAVVEDNEDNMMLVEALLEDHYELSQYLDGKSALEGIPNNLPDLVLLDISLPEMNGTEVLEKLKVLDVMKNIPIIALTAHAMSGDRERLISLGFDDYLSKPIVEEEVLIEAIERNLTKLET
jgi:two-component system cell cycle response regulator DivK